MPKVCSEIQPISLGGFKFNGKNDLLELCGRNKKNRFGMLNLIHLTQKHVSLSAVIGFLTFYFIIENVRLVFISRFLQSGN